MDLVHIDLPTRTAIHVPRVLACGGTFRNVMLINACPVDNFLTIVYTRLKDVPQTSTKLSLIQESWAKDLVPIEKMFDQREFFRGKIEWLPLFRSSTSVELATLSTFGEMNAFFSGNVEHRC